MTTIAPDFQSIESTADRYKVNPRTIRRLIHDGTIEAFVIGTKIIRIDVNATDRLFRKGGR